MTIKEFMRTKKFQILMAIIRIVTLIGVAVLIFIMVKEIEAVKLLAYNPCDICVAKTGCQCYCMTYP